MSTANKSTNTVKIAKKTKDNDVIFKLTLDSKQFFTLVITLVYLYYAFYWVKESPPPRTLIEFAKQFWIAFSFTHTMQHYEFLTYCSIIWLIYAWYNNCMYDPIHFTVY